MTDDEREYGPAMRALTEKQRQFVLAMIEVPGCSHAKAARLAGYSDAAKAAKVRGHYIAHNPKVQDAIREEARRRLDSLSVIAAGVMSDVMLDPKSLPKDKLKAASAVLDRTGFAAAQNINVNKTVTRRVDISVASQRIAEFRQKFPEQFAKLVGEPVEKEPVMIEGEVTDG